MKGTFSIPTGGIGKNVIIFGADMSPFVHVDNKKKDIFILGEGPTLTAEINYSINFADSKILSLNFNGTNS